GLVGIRKGSGIARESARPAQVIGQATTMTPAMPAVDIAQPTEIKISTNRSIGRRTSKAIARAIVPADYSASNRFQYKMLKSMERARKGPLFFAAGKGRQ